MGEGHLVKAMWRSTKASPELGSMREEGLKGR